MARCTKTRTSADAVDWLGLCRSASTWKSMRLLPRSHCCNLFPLLYIRLTCRRCFSVITRRSEALRAAHLAPMPMLPSSQFSENSCYFLALCCQRATVLVCGSIE